MNKSNTLAYIMTTRFWIYFVLIFLVTSHLFLIIQNYSFLLEASRIGIPLTDSFSTIYDFFNSYTKTSFYILLTTLIISSFNLSLFIEYFRIQKNISEKIKNNNGKKMGVAMTLAYVASHCASCGAVLIGGLISTSFLTYLPFGGSEFGIVAIIVMIYVLYDIIKKLNNPYVC